MVLGVVPWCTIYFIQTLAPYLTSHYVYYGYQDLLCPLLGSLGISSLPACFSCSHIFAWVSLKTGVPKSRYIRGWRCETVEDVPPIWFELPVKHTESKALNLKLASVGVSTFVKIQNYYVSNFNLKRYLKFQAWPFHRLQYVFIIICTLCILSYSSGTLHGLVFSPVYRYGD